MQGVGRHAASLLLMVLVIRILTAVCFPEMQTPSATKKGDGIARWSSIMTESRPEVILLGNSMVRAGVDEQLFAQLTRKRTLKMWGPGWASATWYLAVKNVISQSPCKPDTLMLFFRDQFLTDPEFRVMGQYRRNIDSLSAPVEPLLDTLAYQNTMGLIGYRLWKYWPGFEERERVKRSVEDRVKSVAARACGLPDTRALQRQIADTFANHQMDPSLFGQAQLDEEDPRSRQCFDFRRRLSQSFLPAIVTTARENEIQLVLVRVRRRRDAQGDPPSDGLPEYIEALHAWLDEQHVALVDYTEDGRLQVGHYARGDHLSHSQGRTLFTQMLAESLTSGQWRAQGGTGGPMSVASRTTR